MRLPHIQFYGRDWLSDSALRMCCAATRGIWMDMLALMSQAEPYGYLIAGGATISHKQLARATGETEDAINDAIFELESYKVFSRDPAGRIYSRRLVKDYEKINTDVSNGKRGGNPRLKKHNPEAISHNSEAISQNPEANKVNGGVNPPVKGRVKGSKYDDLPYSADAVKVRYD